MSHTQEDYIVAYYEPYRFGLDGPVRVHQRPGDTVKDVQDRMAEKIERGEVSEHLIYFVVLEEDFRRFYQDILDRWGFVAGAGRRRR